MNYLNINFFLVALMRTKVFSMKQFVLVIAALYGVIGITLGAMGAHFLKSRIDIEKIQSFEVGVRYQLFHCLFLLIIGYQFSFHADIEKVIGLFIIIGVFLFSASIYILSTSELMGVNLKFLGPVTPIGGLLIIIGWGLLFFKFLIKQ